MPSNTMETYWENAAKSKWGNYITTVEKQILLRANDLATAPGRGLEIGCEGGRWTKILVDLGWQMICTDINRKTLTMCKQRLPQATCILTSQDNAVLPCPTNTLNLILCIEVVNILWSDWFSREAQRTLQTGGLVMGVFENKLSLRGYFRHAVASLKREYDYYKIAYPTWRRGFCQQGFEMVYEEGLCWFPFTRNSNSPLIDPCVRLEATLGLRQLPSVSPWIVFLARKM